MDELLVVTEACLLISNVKEAREGTFLNARVQELRLLGQYVKLDEHSKACPQIFIFLLVNESLFSLFHSEVYY